MEKIKDIIYQISDILFGLIVLLAVILIFTFQLYGWFNIEMPDSIARYMPNKSALSTYSDSEISSINTKLNPDEKNTSLPLDDDKSVAAPSALPDESSEHQNEIIKDDSISSSNIRNIVISPGSTSNSIGNALYENNIIKSVDDFTKRLDELKLGTKIKAGTFKIPENSSLDEVISIITG